MDQLCKENVPVSDDGFEEFPKKRRFPTKSNFCSRFRCYKKYINLLCTLQLLYFNLQKLILLEKSCSRCQNTPESTFFWQNLLRRTSKTFKFQAKPPPPRALYARAYMNCDLAHNLCYTLTSKLHLPTNSTSEVPQTKSVHTNLNLHVNDFWPQPA